MGGMLGVKIVVLGVRIRTCSTMSQVQITIKKSKKIMCCSKINIFPYLYSILHFIFMFQVLSSVFESVQTFYWDILEQISNSFTFKFEVNDPLLHALLPLAQYDLADLEDYCYVIEYNPVSICCVYKSTYFL